jgi:NADH-quinone oxidoreductase subunit K
MILSQFLVLASILFALGVYGLLARRNAVTVLLAVELMLAGVNINLVAFESVIRDSVATGQIFTIFVLTIAAAEVGIGLGIVLMIFRNRTSGNIDELDLMKW